VHNNRYEAILPIGRTGSYPNRYKQAEKKDNDRMKGKFLLHKDKEER